MDHRFASLEQDSTLDRAPSDVVFEADGVAGNSMGLAVGFDKSDPFVGTLEAGDALVHHCQTIHSSAPNKTDHPRCGLLLVYRGSHTQDDPQLREDYTRARPS
ncbi:MAG: phytanoyl-CoA dioxygenase family protein [Planctomycetota bacterium]